jgi:TRAP-type uncharacterized transport system substrate-binding protein
VNLSGGNNQSGKTAKAKPKKVAFNQLPKQQQQRKGKQLLKQQRDKFKKPPVRPAGLKKDARPNEIRSTYRKTYGKNPVYQNAGRYDSSTYHQRRNDQFGGWNSSPPPYVINSPPSFGMWDAMAMYWMMDALTPDQSAQFAYNQQNNADFQMAMAEMEKQAQNNAELQAKMSAMEAKMNGMTGTPDPSFVPEGIDGDLLLSAEAVSSTRPDFRMCVAGETGTYFRVSALMSSSISKVNIVPVITRGSGEALAMIEEKICDGAIVQGDAYWNYIDKHGAKDLPFEIVMTPYIEKTHLVCHKDGPIDDMADLDDDKFSVWFPKGSGAAETWENIVAEDNDFAPVKTVLNTASYSVDSYEEALLKARQDKNSCFLYVGAAGSGKFMQIVEGSAKQNGMVLVDMKDHGILDTTDPSGERKVYTAERIEDTTYPNLLSNEFWDYVDVYGVKADVIVSNAWKSANSKLYPTLATEMMAVQPDISRLVSQ